WIWIVLVSLTGCRMSCSTTTGAAFSTQGELRAGLESPYVLASSDGSALLGVVIEPRSEPQTRSRVPLALVLDKSGSMSGEKIEHARAASRAIVDALADGDEVSLTQFSNGAELLVPRVRVDAATRTQLRDAIARVDATGGTALYDGLRTGLDALAGT